MSISALPPGSVVVGIDSSRSCAAACRWAVEHAALEHRALTLAHGGPTSVTDCLARTRDMIALRAPEVEVHEVVSRMDPRDLLLDLSDDAAIVVIGSRDRGASRRRRLLGSVGLAVPRAARCPVVVHGPFDAGLPRRGILVGTDATIASLPALEFGFRQASLREQPLTVLHCLRDPSAADLDPLAAESHVEVDPSALTEAVTSLAEKYPEVDCRVEVAHGLAAEALRDRGGRMRLTVVGSRHGTGLSRLLFGAVAAAVVEEATSAVAVVPTG